MLFTKYLFHHLANYCFTKREAPEGLMLLCEVALGQMCECVHATTYSTDTLPTGTQSVKGRGQTAPDPKGTINKSLFHLKIILFSPR